MNLRKYGQAPFTVAVVHGGPGAPGEMADIARELSSETGVLEPLQTADTVQGQVEELRDVLEKDGSLPITVIGFSWGAWLGCILAASCPHCVRKLILVSSGPFEDERSSRIMKTRLGRLAAGERREAELLYARLNTSPRDDAGLVRFGQLMSKADAYDPLPEQGEPLPANIEIYQKVWNEAAKTRSSGELLRLAGQVSGPVVAIHGDYDSHPAQAIRGLSATIRDFRFILLDKCGHHPWLERHARNRFFEILKREI